LSAAFFSKAPVLPTDAWSEFLQWLPAENRLLIHLSF